MFQKLEIHMSQLDNQLATIETGSMPRNTEKNLRDMNAIMVVTRSQKEEPKKSNEGEEIMRPNTKESKEDKHSSAKSTTTDISKIHFPQRAKQLIILHINILFADVLAQMPTILQNKLPPKLKDPGSFSIPCTIGNSFFSKTLCDLGANINLMSYSCFGKLGIGEVRPNTISLQLADRSIKYSSGIVEYVLVKVDNFIFPVDFVVLDMEEDREIPLILGIPFLETRKDLIDVKK
ncbi:uncharacterized protein [Henckelia pumila]|uniref:uncharacterized protein n=1 Tax=Henckelia pumila TaxID=405737 RepID=UPI003C6DDA4A